jgi:mycothiol synthase
MNEIRPATLDDVDRLAAFMGRCTLAHQGVRRDSPGEMRQRLTKPGTDPALDSWIVEREDAEVAGFAQVWSDHPHTEVVCYVRVDPEHTGRGIGSALLERGAERAKQLATRAEAGRRVALHATSWPNDASAKRLLEQAGFTTIRYFLLMTIDLDGQPEPPRWPEGVEVRVLDEDSDLRPVYEAQTVIFSDHWGESRPEFEDWLHEYTGSGGFDPTLWFVVEDSEGIAGFVLCLPELAEDPDAGYVGELGVRSDRRGAGLGLALLLQAFKEFADRGKQRVSLHVDADNLSGALRLYTKAGMRPEPRIVVWERELSPTSRRGTEDA